jgi:hypothetical protein
MLAIMAVASSATCILVEGEQFARTVEKLEIGTPEDQVLERLGQPSDSGTRFYLAQEESFEAEYRAAAESRSVRYLFWRKSVDIVCAVGFDRDKRVSYKACGGT